LLLFVKKGRLKPSAYAEVSRDKPFGAKKAIERIGKAMRASFGLAAHPIHSYSKRARLWEARFLIADGADREQGGEARVESKGSKGSVRSSR
jgi:hypothetical protein